MSFIRQQVSAVALAALVLTSCGHHVYHRVEAGDTLYSVGWRYGEDYRDVAAWNGITAPYRIREGQILRLVPPEHYVPRSASRQASRISSSSNFSGRKRSMTSHAWQWPADGTVNLVHHSGTGAARGVEIFGNSGQAVRAAAAGRVVYTGNSLKGYGNLVIVKHDDEFLSAYAHNKDIVVREGEEVTAGQKVAEMGRNNNNRTVLYFEIRRHGKSEDPLRYLPVRR